VLIAKDRVSEVYSFVTPQLTGELRYTARSNDTGFSAKTPSLGEQLRQQLKGTLTSATLDALGVPSAGSTSGSSGGAAGLKGGDGPPVSDYRHAATRKNNPPAKIAAEGTVPVVSKARYAYNAHLPPVLWFDPGGRPDALPELVDQLGGVRGVSRGGLDSRVGQVTGYASRHSAAPLPTTPLVSPLPGARGVRKPTPLWWTPRGDSQFPRESHESTHHVWWSGPCRRPISAA